MCLQTFILSALKGQMKFGISHQIASLLCRYLIHSNMTFALYVHDDVIKWKHFPCYWSFERGIQRSHVNSPHKGQPSQRPVTRSFGVFFDVPLNQLLSKQSWGWWFETLSRPLRRHCNGWNVLPLNNVNQVTIFFQNLVQTLSRFWMNLH